MTTSANKNDKNATVANIVRTDFAEFYEGQFDVIADQTVDEWADEDERGYVRVFIIFDGTAKDIPTVWSRGVMSRVRKKLYEANIDELPILAPVSKTEWERTSKHRKSAH